MFCVDFSAFCLSASPSNTNDLAFSSLGLHHVKSPVDSEWSIHQCSEDGKRPANARGFCWRMTVFTNDLAKTLCCEGGRISPTNPGSWAVAGAYVLQPLLFGWASFLCLFPAFSHQPMGGQNSARQSLLIWARFQNLERVAAAPATPPHQKKSLPIELAQMFENACFTRISVEFCLMPMTIAQCS